jgi:hypothetical protein
VHRPAQLAGGQGGDHLVGVHVGRRARAGLEDVDRELVVVAAVGDVRGGGHDRLGQIVVDHPERRVDLRGRALDLGQRADVRGFQPAPGDREVLHRPLGLCPPQGGGRHPDLAHGVAFDPETTLVSRCHGSILPPPAGVRS